MKRKIVIFSDIDELLVGDDFCVPKKILKILNHLKKLDIPLVLTSIRTRSELEFYRKKFTINHPFISENGGGIFVPNNYFSDSFLYSKKNDQYKIIELGLPYLELRRILKNIELKIEHQLNGFGDMPPSEISKICQIPIEDAKLTKMRDYEEPFILDDPTYEKEIYDRARWAKVNLRKESNLYYLTGDNNREKAIKLLTGLYEKEFDSILGVGVGYKKNDESLFSQVQIPILLPDKEGNYASISSDIPVRKEKEAGPTGWNKAVSSIVARFGP